MPLDTFFTQISDPPREYGAIAFWFWNDDLDAGELLRQLHAFHTDGFGGVIIHPRVGLSGRIGYLTEAYFRLVRRVVDECAALGMKVILYDEGSYPSGSACGQVVAVNPRYAARALVLVQRDIPGPWRGYWRPAAGRSLINRLVCVVAGRMCGNAVDPSTLDVVPVDEGGLVRLALPAGPWRLMACFDVPSGGRTRGVLPEQEDGTATAPAAGDIMNPDAVSTFIRLTHDAYARHLQDHFGTTVIGMFTDEPSPLGRGARRDGKPYTPGFEKYLARRLGREDVRAWLPALWVDYGPGTDAFRQAYTRAVRGRLQEVFYAAQAAWCAQHGLALTGHPAESNDMASLESFQWPGQDMVWRWVVPGDASSLVGPHSVAPKAATSAARAGNRRRAGTELFGAYGWRLTLDEAKWLIDWHLARGNNLFMPHALFYSVRDGRAFESEPDLSLHNVWRPHFQHLVRYVHRMSWLLTDCEHVCGVAVLGRGHDLPWQAARYLYEHQIDFLYLDDASLRRATAAQGRLTAGTQSYGVVIVDGEVELSEASEQRLVAFQGEGGKVLHADEEGNWFHQLEAAIPRDVRMDPPAPGLRAMHVRKAGLNVYAIYNEGEVAIEGILTVSAVGAAEWWDPLRQIRQPVRMVPAPGPNAGTNGSGRGLSVRLCLERRESRLLVIDPLGWPGHRSERTIDPAEGPPAGEPAILDVPGPWTVTEPNGRPVPAPAPGDWTTIRELERFSGTLVYRAPVMLPDRPDWVEVELGTVGEAASVAVNGVPLGFAMWAPYRLTAPHNAWQAGENWLEVQVTNSAANWYEGAMRPSGLMGPVLVRTWKK